MPHSHIIISGRWDITNWHCNNSYCHMCIMWGTLASRSENFWSPLQSDITLKSSPHQYSLKFPIVHLMSIIIPQICVLYFTVVTMLLLRWDKLGKDAVLQGTYWIHISNVLFFFLWLSCLRWFLIFQTHCYHTVILPVFIDIKPLGWVWSCQIRSWHYIPL